MPRPAPMPARARYKFGPQGLFYNYIFPHFRKNAARVARAFLGSACEQWINGECFQSLIDTGHWVRPELHKRDLVLFRAANDNDAALVIESKVLYSSETLNVQRNRLSTLAAQLTRAAGIYPQASVVGIVTYFDWGHRPTGSKDAWTRPGASRRPFVSQRERGQLGLRNAFGQARRHLAPQTVTLGSHQYHVDASLEIVRAAG